MPHEPERIPRIRAPPASAPARRDEVKRPRPAAAALSLLVTLEGTASSASGPVSGKAGPGGDPVRVFHSLQGLQELRPVWDLVKPPWGSPMMSAGWIRAWAEVYGLDADLEWLVAGEGPALAIAPLVRSRKGGLRYELAGPDNLTESMDFLYEEAASIPALVAALVRSRVPLRFWRVPADSPVVPMLREASRRHALVRFQSAQACPSLPLDASWARAEDHLDAHRRSNVRRARRIAEAMGPVRTDILSPRPDEVGPLLEEAYAVEAAGWKSREGSPIGRDPLLADFFRRYAKAAAESGELRICFLRVGGRAAAMKLAATTGGRFWLLAMGFSEEFERCSPGTLLLLDTIEYAARSGLRSYEFLGADEPWVRALGTTLRPSVSLRTYPFGMRGLVALGFDAADRARNRLRDISAWVGRTELKVERKLALAYSAGPRPEDAVRVADALTRLGYRTIVGYIDKPQEAPRIVARNHAGALEGVVAKGLDCYVSLKAPALGFDHRLVEGIVRSGHDANRRVHFDALSANDVDRTFDLIHEMQRHHDNLGTTLPGRWIRSTADAIRAIDLGLRVRVIKGEWADVKERERKPFEGFLEIVDRLAGSVPEVGVATHNPAVARKAVRRLRAAGTPCEIEVVRGYPIHRILPVALEEDVPVRVYVPFGHLASPYTLGQVVRRPRIAAWVVRDIFRGGTSVVPPDPRSNVDRGPTPP